MAFNDKEQQIIRWGAQNGKTQPEIEAAITKLRATNAITPAIEQNAPSEPFLKGIVSDFKARTDNAANSQLKALEGQQTDASAAFQTIAQGFGFMGDIGARVFSAITPDPLGKLGIDALQKAIATPSVQEAITKYQSFKEANPELAANLEAAGLIAPGLLAPGAANATVKTALNVAGRSAKALNGITKIGAEGITEAASKAVNPEALMQRVARISKSKQTAFEERAGESVGKYLVSREIFGDVDEITTQLFQRMQKSKGEVDKALDSLPGTYKTTPIGTALKELVAREEKVSTPGAVSKDLDRIRELQKKHLGEGLTMSEINEAKRLYERKVRLDYLKENVPTNIERANNLDTAIREWQQNTASQLGFKNIQDLNRETSLAKQLLDDLGAEYAGSAGNNAVTLTDWILLAGTSADPTTAIGSFIAKKTLSSKPVLSKIAQVFSKRDPLGQPAAKMDKPTIDNYLNFLRKTTEASVDIDEPIKDYLNNAQPGLSIKPSITPEKVAKNIDARDATRLNEYISDPHNADVFIRAQDLLEQIGIEKAEIPTQVRFIKEVLDLWQNRK